jgi:hypothetical protein
VPAKADVTLWTVRAACALYTFALALWLAHRPRFAPYLWTAALVCYLGHVVSAFAFHYAWSHQAAYAETARQTAELFKVRWGGGLYFNYAFTALWAADVLWMWASAASYRSRPRWAGAAVHAFLAFMFFNATVVFASGWVRWLGLAALAGVTVIWLLSRLTSHTETGQTISL